MSMQVRRWEPFRELDTMRDTMDRMFEESFWRPLRQWQGGEAGMPAEVDMVETDKNVVVKASLPGIKPEEVDINITGNTLTIRGEHTEEKEEKEGKGRFLVRERRYGSFFRAMELPTDVKADKADAVFENGVLTLTLPKEEAAKPKQIKVKARESIESPKAETKSKAASGK